MIRLTRLWLVFGFLGPVSSALGLPALGLSTRMLVVLGLAAFISPSATAWAEDPPAGTTTTKPATTQPGPGSQPTHKPAPPPVAPPGVTYDGDLLTGLRKALAERGPHYSARTHHKSADGTPRFINRLIHENSPYLLQHAHNPVNWYPWGPEAFAEAARLDRPIFFSSGYSTCHWCHVMERESFEDLEIAQFINENYIPIKLDRERRPDVDRIYMTAVRMLIRRGGWPMTVLMTPDRKPFFGGTYFPPRDGDRGMRKGFLTILREMATYYKEDRESAVAQAEELSRRIQEQSLGGAPAGQPGAAALHASYQALQGTFDPRSGGFGRQPKFPRPSLLNFLLQYHRRTQEPMALHMVTHSLDKMANGGIYDQIGGGFHRYAVDRDWLVPHFEKMLYDNAQLVNTYLDAYLVVQEPKAARIAEEILRYIQREMIAPHHGFYSATDADSMTPSGHSEEGWFFTWTPKELGAVLTEEELRVVTRFHGVKPGGNFEGRNILWVPSPPSEAAATLEVTEEALQATLKSAHEKLYAHRQTRPAPLRDDKIIAGWNGLMISAFARGSWILRDHGFLRTALGTADYITRNMIVDGRLRRISLGGKISHEAVLEDYAFLIHGLLDLHQASQRTRWLETALQLQQVLDQEFWDEENGGYFSAHKGAVDLLTREKPAYDGAIPSGNSYAARNLLRLHELTTRAEYRERATKIFATFSNSLNKGNSLPSMARALDFALDRPQQIALVRSEPDADIEPFLDVLRKTYLPNKVLVITTEGPLQQRVQKLIPWIEGKTAQEGPVAAYVCERGQCLAPTSDPKVFAEQVRAVAPLPSD